MKKHTKIYMKGNGFDTSDWIPCENCNNTAVDIHHITPRGIGGDPLGHRDQLENLIALCRSCHIKAEMDKNFNNLLKEKNKIKYNENK
jgi:5-methylcytosine-specific restriction endonuclease McrA